jgi:hypothetical protein
MVKPIQILKLTLQCIVLNKIILDLLELFLGKMSMQISERFEKHI